MLVLNNRCFIGCQSCCCTMSKVARLPRAVAVECTHFMSHKCSCKLPTCSDDGDHLRKTVVSREGYCQSLQFQEGVNVVQTRDLPCSTVSGHPRCTCSTESPVLSAAHHTVCTCLRGSTPPENLLHIVRHGNSVNYVQADISYTQHCCRCVRNLGMPSCNRDVMSSSTTTSLCPRCTEFAQVNRPGEHDNQLTSRHSDTDLHSIHEERNKAVDNLRHAHIGSVMDVQEWQRRHIEHLDRQKLEVYVTLSVCRVCYQEKVNSCFPNNISLQLLLCNFCTV